MGIYCLGTISLPVGGWQKKLHFFLSLFFLPFLNCLYLSQEGFLLLILFLPPSHWGHVREEGSKQLCEYSATGRSQPSTISEKKSVKYFIYYNTASSIFLKVSFITEIIFLPYPKELQQSLSHKCLFPENKAQGLL